MNANRICKICKESKLLSKFTKNKLCNQGREHKCRSCTTKNSVKWEQINRAGYKEAYLKYHYNMTLEQYNGLLSTQNNICAICKNPEIEIWKKTGKLKDLAVDHCHVSGDIRGLLCRKCNTGLGSFRDNIEYLTSAIVYLTK